MTADATVPAIETQHQERAVQLFLEDPRVAEILPVMEGLLTALAPMAGVDAGAAARPPAAALFPYMQAARDALDLAAREVVQGYHQDTGADWSDPAGEGPNV